MVMESRKPPRDMEWVLAMWCEAKRRGLPHMPEGGRNCPESKEGQDPGISGLSLLRWQEVWRPLAGLSGYCRLATQFGYMASE